jgi:hypothetical protein
LLAMPRDPNQPIKIRNRVSIQRKKRLEDAALIKFTWNRSVVLRRKRQGRRYSPWKECSRSQNLAPVKTGVILGQRYSDLMKNLCDAVKI